MICNIAGASECSYLDDYGNTPGAAHGISAGGIPGVIEVQPDRDIFSFSTVPFGDYRVQITPAGAGPVDSLRAVLLAPDGTTPLVQGDTTGSNGTAELAWNGSAQALNLYVDVRALGEFSTGQYLLTLTSLLTAWTDGGNADWFSQTGTQHDGIAALQSGGIGSGQSSWIETSVDGPGTLRFWWNVSSQSGSDYLRVYLDGGMAQAISGTSGWVLVELVIPAGSHTVRWAYEKDGSGNSGSDAGWISEVVFERDCDFVLTPVQQTFNSNGGTGVIGVDTAGGCAWVAEESLSWVTLTGGVGGTGNGTLHYTVAANTGTSSRFGTITVSGQPFGISQQPSLLNCMMPGAAAAVTAVRPTFTWCTLPGATWYNISISKDGKLFHSQWLEQLAGSFTPDFDLPCGSYTWWIRAWYPSTGNSPWAGPATFTRPCCIPLQPIPLTPADCDDGFGNIEYTWLGVNCATWYQVAIYLNGTSWKSTWYNTGEVAGPVSRTVGSHGYGAYTWWVRGWGPDGYSPWSPGRNFALGAIIPDRLSETELCWQELCNSGATWLQAWISRNGKTVIKPWFDLALVTGSCATLPETLVPGSYDVQTRGWNAGAGNSPWSPGVRFVLGAVDPVSLSATQACWDGSAAAAYTFVQIYVNKNGVNVMKPWIDLATAGGACADLPETLPAGTYEVWVRGWRADTGNGPWSEGTAYIVP